MYWNQYISMMLVHFIFDKSMFMNFFTERRTEAIKVNKCQLPAPPHCCCCC